MMGVQNAWRFTKGSTGVLIGVQDSGLGVNSNGIIHPDLPTTTVFPNNYQDDFRRSNESHGTGVQGIIAAKSDNGIGMSGINWNSRVFNIDVLDGGLNENDQDLAQAALNMINEANRNGQRLVINMSLGIPGSFGWTGNNRAFQQVVASNPNVLFVIAAGNSGHLGRAGIADPAVLAQQYGNVIAVGASWELAIATVLLELLVNEFSTTDKMDGALSMVLA